MGFMFGGFIIKNGASLSDEALLHLLNRQASYSCEVSLEEATGGSFEGIAIARTDAMAVLLGSDIAYSCSFEEGKLTEADKKLALLSKKGDILCFLLNGVADTYAWSIFSKGKRVHAKAIAEQKVLSEAGETTAYEQQMKMNDLGIQTLIENFIGYPFLELVFEKELSAAAYSG